MLARTQAAAAGTREEDGRLQDRAWVLTTGVISYCVLLIVYRLLCSLLVTLYLMRLRRLSALTNAFSLTMKKSRPIFVFLDAWGAGEYFRYLNTWSYILYLLLLLLILYFASAATATASSHDQWWWWPGAWRGKCPRVWPLRSVACWPLIGPQPGHVTPSCPLIGQLSSSCSCADCSLGGITEVKFRPKHFS